ncbi:MAG: nitroreductase family protein [Planctomycetota bacterium]|nr:MAG: nitroreductase family protein [Planctomycetota bacterium]
MDTLQAIRSRRAIKHYDPEHRMPPADLEQLLDHALLSPTAFNIQHWRFVVVDDPALRAEIRAVAWDQAQVTDASALLLLTADTQAWAKDAGRYWAHAPQPVQDFLVPTIGQYYQGNAQAQRDECFRSMGIAAQTIMLTAKAMGYDSCPMDGFDFNAVAKLVKLPDDHVIGLMIAVGKGTQEAWPRPGQLSKSEVVIRNRFA